MARTTALLWHPNQACQVQSGVFSEVSIGVDLFGSLSLQPSDLAAPDATHEKRKLEETADSDRKAENEGNWYEQCPFSCTQGGSMVRH